MATFITTNTARTSAALAAAGAYDTSPIQIPVNGYQEIAFLISYTRGGVGGGISWKVEMSIDGTNWYQTAEIQSAVNVAGSDTIDSCQKAEIKYVSGGASAEKFISPNYNVSGMFARLNCKESGAVGTPGTVFAEYQVRGDA